MRSGKKAGWSSLGSSPFRLRPGPRGRCVSMCVQGTTLPSEARLKMKDVPSERCLGIRPQAGHTVNLWVLSPQRVEHWEPPWLSGSGVDEALY